MIRPLFIDRLFMLFLLDSLGALYARDVVAKRVSTACPGGSQRATLLVCRVTGVAPIAVPAVGEGSLQLEVAPAYKNGAPGEARHFGRDIPDVFTDGPRYRP